MTLLAKDEKRLEVIGEGLREARETLARLDLREWEARLVYDRAVDYLGMTADLYLRARHLPRSDSAKRRLTDVILDLRRLGVRDLPAEEDVFEEIDGPRIISARRATKRERNAYERQRPLGSS